MELSYKRIYEPPEENDGFRILVDRLWPRGISKEKARIDLWCKNISPSDTPRKKFGHNPEKWEMFRETYIRQLEKNKNCLNEFATELKKHETVTLLFATKNTEHNNAVVLKEVLDRKLQ